MRVGRSGCEGLTEVSAIGGLHENGEGYPGSRGFGHAESRASPAVTDSCLCTMRWEGDERDGDPALGRSAAGPRDRLLRPVPDSGPTAPAAATPVRLVREWKGPTVGALLRDEDLAAALPGRAVRALSALQRGDLAGADAALPGELERVLIGPWQRRRRLRHFLLATALLLVVVLVLVLGNA